MWIIARVILLVWLLLSYFGEHLEEDSTIAIVEANYLDRMKRMGIQCPEVVTAQIVLETDYLSSKIYRENHNLFGMKESGRNWDIGTKNDHANYPTTAHSILDYREWQRARSKNRVFNNNEEYIYFLGHLFKREDGSWARYATDPEYENKLRAIIQKFKQ